MKEQQKDSDRQCERIVGNPNLRHPTLPLPIGVFLLKKGQGRRCQQIEMPAHRPSPGHTRLCCYGWGERRATDPGEDSEEDDEDGAWVSMYNRAGQRLLRPETLAEAQERETVEAAEFAVAEKKRRAAARDVQARQRQREATVNQEHSQKLLRTAADASLKADEAVRLILEAVAAGGDVVSSPRGSHFGTTLTWATIVIALFCALPCCALPCCALPCRALCAVCTTPLPSCDACPHISQPTIGNGGGSESLIRDASYSRQHLTDAQHSCLG